jgi:dihydrofolate reductase
MNTAGGAGLRDDADQGGAMTRVRAGITMSLDGYVAGPDQSVEHPLGVGGTALHEWAYGLRTFQAMHGRTGGETGLDDDVLAAGFEGLGATVMGRNMFGGGPGPWRQDTPWTGWWGDDAPFHTPVFVLTHHPREPLEMAGGTTFHFVTDGIEAALGRAAAAAGGKDVNVAGGAEAIRQSLAAGLVDDLEVHVVPVLLGAGARLFDLAPGWQERFAAERLVASAAAAHFRFRRVG